MINAGMIVLLLLPRMEVVKVEPYQWNFDKSWGFRVYANIYNPPRLYDLREY